MGSAFVSGIIFFTILHHAPLTFAQTGPPECTYSDDVYACNYTTMTSSDRPIDYSQFSVEPQHIQLYIDGLFPYYGKT